MASFAKEFLAEVERTRDIPYPEGRYCGRGVVTCAGGWKHLPGVYVLARMLRWDDTNCRLPLEVWYIGDEGEFDPLFADITRGLDVRWRDASAELRKLGITRKDRLRGWSLKPLALTLSSFEQVIMLDQDCYPCYDPEKLWDFPEIASQGAAFWPDNPLHGYGRAMRPEQWALFGMTTPPNVHKEAGFEAGQMLVDKRRCWHAVQVAAWLSDRFDDFDIQRGKKDGFWGDKETFNVAWNATRTPYYFAPAVRYHEVAFLQHDPAGAVEFVHRCNDKPRIDLQDTLDGPNRFYHTQFRSMTLHHEAAFHNFLRDLRHKLRPQIRGFRDGTQDQQIWNEVHVSNSYRLPADMTDQVVVDVGAHAGLFSLECLSRGAQVVAVEPFRPNLLLAQENLAPWTGRYELVHAAVGARTGDTVLIKGSNAGDAMTAEPHVHPTQGEPVRTVSLDDLIEKAGGHVDFLKIDCEGSEYPTLATCTRLRDVDYVALEWHTVGPLCRDPQELFDKLFAEGFAVEWTGRGGDIGMMFASRYRPKEVRRAVPVRRTMDAEFEAARKRMDADVWGGEIVPEYRPRLATPVLSMATVRRKPGVAIPKTFHQFWTGPSPLPDVFRKWGDKWQEMNPEWGYRMWSEDEVRALDPELCKHMDSVVPGIGGPATKSDLARVAIILHHGGVWLDTDFEPAKPIGDLFDGLEAFRVNAGVDLALGVFGCVPGHPWMRDAKSIILLHKAYEKPPPAVQYITSGVGADMNVPALPDAYFYPYLASQPELVYKPASTWPEAYGVHRHAYSWDSRHSLMPLFRKFKNRF